MKNLITNSFFAVVVFGTLLSQTSVVLAQCDPYYDDYCYDTGTTYPTYDTGTTYPTYDTGTTYPTYNTGTSWGSTYDTGTTYPTYDTGTTYPTYDTGTTYPTYDTGTTYPTYNTGTTYPTYNTGTSWGSTYDTGTTFPTVNTYNTGTTYPAINYGTPSYGTTNYGNTITGTIIYGSTNWGSTGGTVTCPSGSSYINGTCIVTTIQCPSGATLINGQCIVNTTNCPIGSTLINGTCRVNTTTCPSGSTLVNGNCVLNTTICPSGSTLINGQCVINNTNCPAGTTLINGTCQINNTNCPSGSTLINGTCVLNTTNCPNGSTLINGTCQINNTSCPSGSTLINGTCQITNITCPSGSTLINGVCQAPISCPTGTYYTNGVCQGTGSTVCPLGSTLINGVCQINTTACPAGSTLIGGICQITNATCPVGTHFFNGTCQYQTSTFTYGTTQTCWTGSVIPSSQVCPSQYRTCLDGSVIPVNQICYTTPQYIAPPVVKFNNVVTSITTEITNKSARCNGIGLIANGASSVGWFEYGETASLGRETAKASIGQALSAPFSNALTNLKPATSYYCRAVMSNQYGTVKGEIVRFTTKSTQVTYVKPIVKAPVVKAPVVKTPVKQEVVCIDGSTVKVDSKSSATLLSEGQKLISVQLEKVQGEVATGKDVIYRMTYKNLSDVPLDNILIKLALPTEFTFVGSTAGTYDATNNTLTVSQSALAPYSEGILTWTVRVKNDVLIGKSLVTSAYVLYTIPQTQGKTSVQDEVTAYLISVVIPASPDSTNLNNSEKKVIGATSGLSFLPSTLVEWLALIAILFIIAILARSIYLSSKEDKHHEA